MNQNGTQTSSGSGSKRNKNRSNMNTSMSSNIQRQMSRNSLRNNYPNSNMRGGGGGDMASSSRNYQSNKPLSSPSNINSGGSPNQTPSSVINANNNNNNHIEVGGVYKNKRLVHAITSLIGCLIEVQLEDGKRFEGILETFSSEFELALRSAVPVFEDSSSTKAADKLGGQGNNIGNLLSALERKEEIIETLLIDTKKLVTFKVVNVDMDYATKKAIMTDSEIAKHDGTKQYRELVPWESDDIDGSYETLESSGTFGGGSNGWKTEDMFKLNERKYNIETTYNDDMLEYTIKLEHRNDEEYKQRELQAEKIAREIEQDFARTSRYSKEDELDEETRYSAVIRDDEATSHNNNANNLPTSSSSSTNPNYTNHQNYRNESMNHSRDDPRSGRGDNVRNNSNDNMFRQQSSRRRDRDSRGNRGDRGGDRSTISGPNEPNWRESNRNVTNQNRYHQTSSMAYGGGGGNQNKSNTSGSSGYGSGGPASGKYINQQTNQQQYSSNVSSASQANKQTSYSAVSARNVSTESIGSNTSNNNNNNSNNNNNNNNNNEPEPIKPFSGRGSGGHPKEYGPPPTNEDGYSRKSATVNMPQRDSYKPQQQRPSYSRIVEPHHHSQESNRSPSSSKEPEFTSKTPLATSPSTPTEPLLKMTPKSETSGSLPSRKSDDGHSSHQTATRMTSPKNAGQDINNKKPSESMTESKKTNNTKSSIVVSSKDHHLPQDSNETKSSKMVDHHSSSGQPSITSPSSVSSVSPSSTSLTTAITPIVANNSSTNNSSQPPQISSTSSSSSLSTPLQTSSTTNNNTSAVSPPSTTASSTNTNEDIVVVNSKLNPNAKVFTPRSFQTGMPPSNPQTQQTPNVAQAPPVPGPPPPSYHYAVQHMSATTPPSIPTTPSLGPAPATGQFVSYATHPSAAAGPHMATHPNHHHHQHQFIYRNSNIQFGMSMLPPHMVPQPYILQSVQHFGTSMATGVSAPAAPMPTQAGGGPPNVNVNQPGPQPPVSHHMIPNTSVANQSGQPNNGQPVQGPTSQQPNQSQPRQYRSGSKGPSNSNATQQSQQMIRPHHDFSQQSQVANVTGQPIMAGAAHGAQPLPVVFSSSPAVHHHNQNQMHGQQPPIAQLASQPGHNQTLSPFMYHTPAFPARALLPGHPNPLNITQIQPGLYSDQHPMPIYCTEMQPIVAPAQSMAPMAGPQTNMPPPPPQTAVNTGGGTAGPGNQGPGQVPASNSPTT